MLLQVTVCEKENGASLFEQIVLDLPHYLRITSNKFVILLVVILLQIIAQLEYYSAHMCDWATEHYEEKVTAAKNEKKSLALQQVQKQEKINQDNLMKKLKKEKQIFVDDLVCSQNVLRIMRQSGMIEGVNAGEKNNAHEPTTIINSEYLELHLSKGVNFDNYTNGRIGSKKIKNHDEKKNRIRSDNSSKDKNGNNGSIVRFLEALSEDENENAKENKNENGDGNEEEYDNSSIISPFNVDLSSGSADVLHLQCFLIGEKGT